VGSIFCKQPVEKFASGATVVWQGDIASSVFEVVEGVLRVCRLLSDGRRVITGFLYPGDLIGVSLQNHYLYTVETVSKTRLRRFGRNRFQEEINRSAALRPQLFARLCDEMAAAQDQMVLLARKNAEERVCSMLLAITRRMRSAGRPATTIDIPMTRLDMADYLGLTLETVSRTMTSLASRGVIAANGRHSVTIRRPNELVLLAGESDNDDIYVTGSAHTQQAAWPQ
jgi:CRP/FNR family transcriptional regulator